MFQSSSGRPTFRFVQIHTPVLQSLAGLLPFRASSPAYPHIPLFAECLLSTNTVPIRLVADLGCFTSNLYHLPLPLLLIGSLQLAQMCNAPASLDHPSDFFTYNPWGIAH